VRLLLPEAVQRAAGRRVRLLRRTGQEARGRVTDRQQALLAVLAGGDKPVRAALREAGVSRSVLRTLRARGLVEIAEREVSPAGPGEVPLADRLRAAPEDAFQLTAGQAEALTAVCRAVERGSHFEVFLLFGVPGSGKTEVYVRAIRTVVEQGRQALVLIPEIALTAQIVERFACRFGRVAVLHSRVADHVRAATFRRIAAGQVDVVIGTRMAVFAPCPRLGLIVVDEEQDTSFKHLAAPYFHARDVAVIRGRLEQVPVVLGSATPALETWYNAQRGKYRLLHLPDRVPGARPPQVRLVSSAADHGAGSARLSSTLLDAVRQTLAHGRQVILLHNRRGYAVALRCQRCGLVVRCERCGTSLVYHRSEKRMKCHRCGAQREPPRHCLDDTCGGRLESGVAGIERLEQELRDRLPGVRLQRLDSDTMRRRADYEAALQRFAQRGADILLGTQMVAKGLDFPDVELVGVLEAEAALWIPDFRATERLFHLLMQVVGRAGRRDGQSQALIQTADPHLPVFQQAVQMDYAAFAASELAVRHSLGYPPFSRLVRIICFDRRAGRVRSAAESLASGLRELSGRIDARVRVDDAEPCVIPRLRDMFRWHVRVCLPRSLAPRRLLLPAYQQRVIPRGIDRVTIDVDPLEML